MARFRHPHSVGLPFKEWPVMDREAWEAANQLGDLLTGSGPAAAWKPKTRQTVIKAYGNWLRQLKEAGELERSHSVGARLKTNNLLCYVAKLRARVSPCSVVTQLRSLSQAVAALDPGADRETLKLAISRLERIASPTRLK